MTGRQRERENQLTQDHLEGWPLSRRVCVCVLEFVPNAQVSKARFPLPELTGDRFPLPVNTARVMETGRPSNRVVETGL